MPAQAERIARLQLARTDGIGPVTFKRLLARFGTAVKAVEALPDYSRRSGRAKALIPASRQSMEAELQLLEKAGATLVVWEDETYPPPLAAIEDAPAVLTVLGNPALLQQPCIGVVGARNASLQGRRFAETLAADLGKAGLCVVSGLARGIDTSAHGAALATGTVAVVAGGVDVVYPPENKQLYDRIAAQGCIVAENPPGMQPLAQHFPRRNRIISGLSQGVVIVEATAKSGSLITATMAAEQGREVFAVPGHPFDPRASGPNALIKDGATLVAGAADVLDALARQKTMRIVREPAPEPFEFAPAEPDAQTLEDAHHILCSLLGAVPFAIDEIIRETGLPVPILQTALLELELAGRLIRHPQNRVSMPFSAGGMDSTAVML